MPDKLRTFNRRIDAQIEQRDMIDGSPKTFHDRGRTTITLGDSVLYSPYENPGWRQKISRRESATTNLTVTRRRITSSAGMRFMGRQTRKVGNNPLETWETEIKGDWAFYLTAFDPDPIIDLTRSDNLARERMLQACLKAQRQVMSLVSAGEFGETLRMMRRPLRSLFEGLTDYTQSVKKRAGNFRDSRKKKRKIVADTWLEYSFGWVPLYNDVQQFGEAAARIANGGLPHRVVGGSGREEFIFGSWPEGVGYGPLYVSWRKFARDFGSVRYHGCVTCNTSPVGGSIEALGLRPRDFIPTLWELIPYSFVVDYFTNASNIIDAWTFNYSDLKWCEKSTWQRREDRLANFRPTLGVQTGFTGGILVSTSGQEPTRSREYMTRRHYNASLATPLRFEIPGLSMKWLNLGALFASSRSASRHIDR